MDPKDVIGDTTVIQMTGQKLPSTLKEKVASYLRSRFRSMTQEHRYRGDVIRAMMDSKSVLKIVNKVIKIEGTPQLLTAEETVKQYGFPPEPLLAAEIAGTTRDFLDTKIGEDTYTLKKFELTWSEDLAKWLNSITPLLLGDGLILLFIEYKPPKFGIFGMSGIALLLVAFLSNYIARLAGSEEILVFLLGIVLLGVELFITPGTFIACGSGILLILGSLLWALADT